MTYTWLSVITIISIITLARTFYHDVHLEVDYSGILVGILGALCTVLIGWQIYNIIDFSSREKKNQESINKLLGIIKDMKENGNRGDYLLYDYLSDVYENLLSNDIEKRKFERIHFKINAINYASRILDFETCEIGIKVLLLFISKYDPIISPAEKDRLITFCCSIPNQNRIKNFTDMIHAISSIKTQV